MSSRVSVWNELCNTSLSYSFHTKTLIQEATKWKVLKNTALEKKLK